MRLEPYRRHAEYFLRVLKKAGDRYTSGPKAMKSAFVLFQSELSNIRLAQEWAAEQFADASMARALAQTTSEGCVQLADLFQEPRDTIRWITRALEISDSLNSLHTAVRVPLLIILGRAYLRLNDIAQAHQILSSAVSHGRHLYGEYELPYFGGTQLLTDRVKLATALDSLSAACSAAGHFEDAELHSLRAVAMFRHYRDADGRHTSGERRAIFNLGHVYLTILERRSHMKLKLDTSEITNYATSARTLFLKVERLSLQNGDNRLAGYALVSAGLSSIHLRQLQDAIQYYDRAIQLLDDLGLSVDAYEARFRKSLALHEAGDRDSALTLLASVIAQMKRVNHPLLPRANKVFSKWTAPISRCLLTFRDIYAKTAVAPALSKIGGKLAYPLTVVAIVELVVFTVMGLGIILALFCAAIYMVLRDLSIITGMPSK